MLHTQIRTFEHFNYQNKSDIEIYKLSNLKMGNKIPTPILEKDEAISRWNKNDIDQLKKTFETFARIQSKDKMSKSAFQNYVFPFIPKNLIDRLFVVFQLQFIDNDLKFNYKRNLKITKRYKSTTTNSNNNNNNNPLTANLQKNNNPKNSNDDDDDDDDTKKKKKKKKKKKLPKRKVGKVPFLSFTVNYNQFLIGMTVIIHGSNKEKLSLFWRMFDISNSDSLSYYDFEDILDILLKLETNFFNKTSDQLLYDLFTFKLPSNEQNDASKLRKINDNEYQSDNEEEKENKINKNDVAKTEIEIQEKIDRKSNDFDINELIEYKMQDIKPKQSDQDTSTPETKTDEKAQLLKNDNMNNNTKSISNDSKKSKIIQSNEELEELQEKLISFEHFYEWSKQYIYDNDNDNNDDGNPFISWLCNTFPPPPIQPLPPQFNQIWKELYINCDNSLIHKQYGYLCTDNHQIYTMAQESKC